MFSRHQAKQLPRGIACNHNGKTYYCQKLTPRDVYTFHKSFYSCKSKIEQDGFILKYCRCSKPKRERHIKENSSRKSISVKYFIKKAECRKFEIQVCQKTFLNTLCISKDRVQRVAKRHLETGLMPLENRGGDRVSVKYEAKRIAVRQFIENLKGVESHYCRAKVDNRQYLQSGLSISKLWRLYNEASDLDHKVKRSFFQSIFTKEYNIGFKAPVTDACSKCIELSEKIKSERDINNKKKLS